VLVKELPVKGRSVHRPKDHCLPRIETRWKGKSKPFFTLTNSHLEYLPLFESFNKDFFCKNILPNKKLTYRYEPTKTVPGKELKKLINKLFQEIRRTNKTYSDFTILRSRDFNRRKCSGLIILKCKHHPFVVKVFIETPETFIKHNSKGLIPAFFFHMAGGINRHLLGFTRIKNLEKIKKMIAKSENWTNLVTFPRKWFFMPKKTKWIEISGYNIGAHGNQKTSLPGTYCIISDWVNAERISSVFNREDRRKCMQLCNYLDLVIDPHIDNFLIEKNTKKVAIVDTEDFHRVVGLKEKKKFTGYFSWFSHMAAKCLHSLFLRTKRTRRSIQSAQCDMPKKKGADKPPKA